MRTSLEAADAEAPGSCASHERGFRSGVIGRPGRAACFLACVAFAAAALGYFHNRVWISYDDGTYLHVADRLVQGEVLNSDVQDIHAGYINFANAFALRLFGNDAVSPRYPLIAMGLLNAALAFCLLAKYGTPYAVAASVATTCLSYVQFMNPSAHWYGLFLCLVIVGGMTWLPPGRRRHVCLGLLVGLVFLFRQLTGVFVAIGVLLYLLLELPQHGRGKQTWGAKALVSVMALGLTAYLARKTDAVVFAAYGIWPLGVVLWGWRHVAAPNRDVARMLLRFSLGGAVAALPLVAYHVYHGSVGPWLNDTVVSAVKLTEFDFFDDIKYWMYVVSGAMRVTRPTSVPDFLLGLFWLVAPILPAILGLIVVGSLWESGRRDRRTGPAVSRPPLAPLPFLAVFYFLVALHYQKYMYFFFAAPVTMMGLLVVAQTAKPTPRRAVLGLVWGLSAIGFVFVAGSFVWNVVPGRSTRLVADHGIPRCSLWLDSDLADTYVRIRELVDREVDRDQAILALPIHPELYYLTGRHNPTRFYHPSLGLRSQDDLGALLRRLERSPPKLVFNNPESYYATTRSRAIMDWVAQHYENMGTYDYGHPGAYGKFEVYRHRGSRRDGSAYGTR